jgi:hypothetical protein
MKPVALATAVLLVALATVVWPLPLHLVNWVDGHWDAFFSVWRLAWVADALVDPGLHLFNAPIFHPHDRTLAFSDAVLLPAVVAAPLRYAGVAPVLVYNLVLATAFVTSGLALFALVRELTGRWDAALVSATIYMLAPYRLEHFNHLEMQMAAFMPLGLWFWHRAVDRPSAASAAAAVGAGVLQWLSCIYYGLLFAPYALVMAAIEWARVPSHRRAWLGGAMAAAGLVGVIVIALYSRPYLASRQRTGDRPPEQLAGYSATPFSYVAVNPRNAVYGAVLPTQGNTETRQFPGLLALALGAIGAVVTPWSRRKLAYLAAGVVAFDLSLGSNGLLIPLLRELVVPYRGLRAPARAGILVLLTLSVFAGWGASVVLARMRTVGASSMTLAIMVIVLVVEYRMPPDPWAAPESGKEQHLGITRGAVAIELPMALPERIEETVDAWYMVSRIGAWPSLVNGYSGYYPDDYIILLDRIRLFPDDRALREIARVGTTVIAVHQRWYGSRFEQIISALDERKDVERVGHYQEDSYEVVVYRIVRR